MIFLFFFFGQYLMSWVSTQLGEGPIFLNQSTRIRIEPSELLGVLQKQLKLNGSGETFRNVVWYEGYLVMTVLAMAGSILVGNDFRYGSLPFYLSKPLSRWHYLLGKFLAVGVVVNLLTTLPALALYAQHMLDDWDYLTDPDFFWNTNTGTGPAVRGDSVDGRGLLGRHTGMTGTGAGVTGETASTDPAAVAMRAQNTGTGPALNLLVKSAAAPPLEVNSSAKVANLNADLLDGNDSSAFLSSSPGAVGTSSLANGAVTIGKVGSDVIRHVAYNVPPASGGKIVTISCIARGCSGSTSRPFTRTTRATSAGIPSRHVTWATVLPSGTSS